MSLDQVSLVSATTPMMRHRDGSALRGLWLTPTYSWPRAFTGGIICSRWSHA